MASVYPLSYGDIFIAEENNAISSIKVASAEDYASKSPTKLTDRVAKQLEEYFQGKRKSFDFPFQFKGTTFQKEVWQEVSSVPYGETRTYSAIAKSMRRPLACRAVGQANNKNALLFLIPCHRVIGKNNTLTGYAGGLTLKEKLLALEKDNR